MVQQRQWHLQCTDVNPWNHPLMCTHYVLNVKILALFFYFSNDYEVSQRKHWLHEYIWLEREAVVNHSNLSLWGLIFASPKSQLGIPVCAIIALRRDMWKESAMDLMRNVPFLICTNDNSNASVCFCCQDHDRSYSSKESPGASCGKLMERFHTNMNYLSIEKISHFQKIWIHVCLVWDTN